MKDNVTNSFCELIEQGYLYPEQAFMIHWYGLYTYYGKLTADGKLQLANKPYMPPEPVTEEEDEEEEQEEEALFGENSNSLVCTDLQQDRDLLQIQQQLREVKVELGEEFKAPSTVTESCYRNMQGMPIIWPRNREEEQQQTYQLNPENVRHNGWGKLWFLYVMKHAPILVTIPATKLRKPEDRAKLAVHHMRPFLFERQAEALHPLDPLAAAERCLAIRQHPSQYGQSLNLLDRLRNTGLPTGDMIALLVEMLVQVQSSTQALYESDQPMLSYMQQRSDMIQQRLRQTSSDPLLLSTTTTTSTSEPPPLPDSLLSLDPSTAQLLDALGPSACVGVNEILACSGTDFFADSSNPTAATTATNSEEDVWQSVYQVYQQLLQSFKSVQPQQQPQHNISYYRRLCGYRESESHSSLVQSFYHYIDSCYNGDGDKMKQELMEHIADLYKQVLAACPKSLEDCGGNTNLHWMHTISQSESDPQRNALIDRFLTMSNLVMFMDAALVEKAVPSPPSPESPPTVSSPPPQEEVQQQQGKVLDELCDSFKTVETHEFDHPKGRMQVRDVRIIITRTTLRRVPASKRQKKSSSRQQERKRVRISSS